MDIISSLRRHSLNIVDNLSLLNFLPQILALIDMGAWPSLRYLRELSHSLFIVILAILNQHILLLTLLHLYLLYLIGRRVVLEEKISSRLLRRHKRASERPLIELVVFVQVKRQVFVKVTRVRSVGHVLKRLVLRDLRDSLFPGGGN